jgi:hypothetical protein
MALIQTLIDETKGWLNDPVSDGDAPAWVRDRVRRGLLEEIHRLARQKFFGQAVMLQAVAGTAQYTLPASTVEVRAVVYDGRALRLATEESLRLMNPAWEEESGEPVFYTWDQQAPNVIRITPQPVESGSLVPNIPPVPMLMVFPRNLLVFTWDTPREMDANEGIASDIPYAMELIAEWATVAELTQEAGDYADLDKSAWFDELAGFVRERVGDFLENPFIGNTAPVEPTAVRLPTEVPSETGGLPVPVKLPRNWQRSLW